MSKKREFGEGPIFTVTNYIWWFILGSFYFLLLNIPFTATLMLLNHVQTGAPLLLFLSSIPLGPAATALFSAMGKLVREQDVDITKDFFKAYKKNFVQSLGMWIMELSLLFIMFYDIKFFSKQLPALSFFFIIPGLLIFNTGLYAFPILSRFYMKTSNIIKLSIYHSIKNLKITILNLCTIILSAVIFLKVSNLLLLFTISLVFFIIMYYENNVLKEIEEKLISSE